MSRKKIGLDTKRNVISEYIKKSGNVKDIAVRNDISVQTLYKIINTNKELYNSILENLKAKITGNALLTANRSLEYIDDNKLKSSSGLQLSQISKNLTDITKSNNNDIQVNIVMPKSREELIREVIDITPGKDNTIVNNGSMSTNDNNVA